MLEQRSLLSQFTRFTGATVASLMVFSLYSIVDGLFVAKGVGEFAMAAVNLAVPFTNILFSIAVVFAVGANTIIAIYLGRGEGERADSLLSQNLALLTVIGVAISLLVLVFWRTGSFAALGAAPKYCWFGGVLALAITVTVMLGMGRLGPTLAVATILIAQLSAAAAIDAFGIMGTEKLAFGWSKWAGLALMTGGVLLFKMK